MTADDERDRDALSEPEVADLVRTLHSYGVLTREELLQRSGAEHWVGQSFDGTLKRAVAEGSIKQLGGELFEVGSAAPDLNEGRFDPP
jgi:hypothetical protein